MNEKAIEAARLNTVAEQIVDTCRACRLGKTQASVDYNFDHSRAQCVDFVLTNLRGAALPPLRAREEIEALLGSAESMTPEEIDFIKKSGQGANIGAIMPPEAWFKIGARTAIDNVRRGLDAILSSTAGQEWRDISTARRRLDEIRHALFPPPIRLDDNSEVDHSADENLEAAIISLEHRNADKVSIGTLNKILSRLIAVRAILDAALPAPPVAELLLAEQRPETKP